MTENNVCKTCVNHCCRCPIMATTEVVELAESQNMKPENLPLKKIDDNFYQMDNGIHCFFFAQYKGCILPHDKKPIICQLYPFIPHNFKGAEWELLLDVSLCEGWKDWGEKYAEVKAHFDNLRENSRHWIKEEPRLEDGKD